MFLLITEQSFSDGTQVQLSWNSGDHLLVYILVETTIHCNRYCVCICLLDWSVGALTLWNILYSEDNSLLGLKRKNTPQSPKTHMLFVLELNYFLSLSEAVSMEHYELASHFYSLSCLFYTKSMNKFRFQHSSCSFKIVCSSCSFLLLWLWTDDWKYLINLLNGTKELSEALERVPYPTVECHKVLC